MDSNLQALVGYLEQTLDPDPTVRRQAEKFLESVEAQPGFPDMLLFATANETVKPPLRQAAAIAFKNLVRRQWASEDSQLGEADRISIKTKVIELMLHAPDSIQRQLSEAIAIIAKHDFPERWQELLPLLVEKFATPDFGAINGVLRTANPLFRR